MSKCRQNFHADSEAAINKQANIHLTSYYQYLALAAYYDRDDVGLKGFSKLYTDLAEVENKRAQKLVEFQHLRGGRVVLNAVNTPIKQEWQSPISSVEFALNMEKQVNQSLHETHQLASGHNDAHMSNFIEEEFIPKQVDIINKLAKYHSNLQLVGDGLGVYEFDKELQ